jgi:hypothetical protein
MVSGRSTDTEIGDLSQVVSRTVSEMTLGIIANEVYFVFLAETKKDLPKGIKEYCKSSYCPGYSEYEVTGKFILENKLPIIQESVMARLETTFAHVEW